MKNFEPEIFRSVWGLLIKLRSKMENLESKILRLHEEGRYDVM